MKNGLTRKMNTVLLQGMGQSADAWSEVIEKLPEEMDILCPDLFKRLIVTDRPVVYSEIRRDLRHELRALKEPVNLVGLSLGAILALQESIEHPKNVDRLVLIAPQAKMPKNMLRLQKMLMYLLPESIVGADPLSKKQMIELSESMMDLDFENSLHTIQAETMILVGEKDRVNQAAAKQIASAIPNARLLVVEGSSHEVNKDQPEKLAWILGEFLNGKRDLERL